jgi:hypothetical protein
MGRSWGCASVGGGQLTGARAWPFRSVLARLSMSGCQLYASIPWSWRAGTSYTKREREDRGRRRVQGQGGCFAWERQALEWVGKQRKAFLGVLCSL